MSWSQLFSSSANCGAERALSSYTAERSRNQKSHCKERSYTCEPLALLALLDFFDGLYTFFNCAFKFYLTKLSYVRNTSNLPPATHQLPRQTAAQKCFLW